MQSPGVIEIIPCGEDARTLISSVKSGSITPGTTISPLSALELLPNRIPTVSGGRGPFKSVGIGCTPISGVNIALAVAQRSNPALPFVALLGLLENNESWLIVESPCTFVLGPGETGPDSRFLSGLVGEGDVHLHLLWIYSQTPSGYLFYI